MSCEADYIILGAGMYGLYASKYLADKGYKVVVLEQDKDCFQRASYVNQARVHRGYHYPRSYSTAKKSAEYFERFCKDFDFAINSKFKKIYGIAGNYSLTSGEQFKSFCRNVDIPCSEIAVSQYFDSRLVEQAFETEEYVFDAKKIKSWFLEYLKKKNNFKLLYNIKIGEVLIKGNRYAIKAKDGKTFLAPIVINATYASVNQVLKKFGLETLPIKYEMSEIIVCSIDDQYSNVGLTLMDGPFFSIMPFGFNKYHTLTSVTFTHHKTCEEQLPEFSCQTRNFHCTLGNLDNCNLCSARPKSFFHSMKQLANKYISGEMNITHIESLFAIKPLLIKSELDDSRPTVIKVCSKEPTLITALSGKINTVYDLEKVIE